MVHSFRKRTTEIYVHVNVRGSLPLGHDVDEVDAIGSSFSVSLRNAGNHADATQCNATKAVEILKKS